MLKHCFILLLLGLMLGCATPKPVELPKQNNPLQLNYHPSQPFPFTAEQLLAQLDQLLALQPEELTRQNIERIFKVDLPTKASPKDGVARSVIWEDEKWFYSLGHTKNKSKLAFYFMFIKASSRVAPPPYASLALRWSPCWQNEDGMVGGKTRT